MTRLDATAERIGAKVGLEPLIVIVAIQAVVQLISLCVQDQTPAGVARAAKYPRRRQRRAMQNAVRRELAARGQEAKLAATMIAVHSEIQAMTPAEIAEVCADCSGVTSEWP